MSVHRSVEMSLSRGEFFRLLPAAVPAFSVEGDLISWEEGGRLGAIRLMPLPPRRMAGAELPRHRVEIALQGWPQNEGDAFMERFDRAFLRGGG